MAFKCLAKEFGVLLLSLGMLVHLAGTLFITDGSRITTLLNLTLFLPALFLTLAVPAYRARLFSAGLLFPALFLLFTVAVAWLNSQSEHSVKDQLKISLYVLVYLSAVLILALENRLERLLDWAFILATAAAAASLLYQGLVLKHDLFSANFRLFSLGYGEYANFANAIVSALYYAVFAVYGVNRLARTRGAPRRWVAWILGVTVLCVYVLFTGSRGVWLGMLAAFFVSAVMHMRQSRRNWAVAVGVLLLAVAAFVAKALLGHGERGLSKRDEIWAGWYDRLGEFWLTGAGAGNSFDICLGEQLCFNQAHNLFLQTGYEYGLFAVVLLLLVIVVALVRGADRTVWNKPLGSLGVALMVFAVVTAIVNYHTVLSRPGVYWLVFWLPVGLLINARLMAGQREQARAGEDSPRG